MVAGLRRAATVAVDAVRGPAAALRRARDAERRAAARVRVDEAWADAWRTLGAGVDGAWRGELGPALARLDRLEPRRRRWPAILLLAAALA
ncbi:MAG: hypothetical protein GWN85_16690, partial [Gemmatimonadetes bacterium]|nr:hypothetical protein [Gemmatimonadota bacterium]